MVVNLNNRPIVLLGEVALGETADKAYPGDKGKIAYTHSQTPHIGETETTAYRGDRGKIAYEHSQIAHAPANAQKNSDITKNEIEAVLIGSISTHSHELPSHNSLARATRGFGEDGKNKVVDSYSTLGIDQLPDAGDGDCLEYYVWSEGGEETHLDIVVQKTDESGKFRVMVNSAPNSETEYDLYAESESTGVMSIELTNPLPTGKNRIWLVVDGKNDESGGYILGIGGIRLR